MRILLREEPSLLVNYNVDGVDVISTSPSRCEAIRLSSDKIKDEDLILDVEGVSKNWQKIWPQRDSNPRPYGPAPEAGALDHSATWSSDNICAPFTLFKTFIQLNVFLLSHFN